MDKCNLLIINLFNSGLYLLLFSFKNKTCHIFPNKDRAVKCKLNVIEYTVRKSVTSELVNSAI